jgi:peptidyl-prolyl cis-trans isomerase-like 4
MTTTTTGRIYKIIHNQSNICYVGSTLNRLNDRWHKHKSHYNLHLKGKNKKIAIYPYFKEYGIENFKIILIKEYEVIDRQHLEAYEQLWINKLKTINKKCAFGFKRLQRKKYRETNKNEIRKKDKIYREKNKKRKCEYYEENKDKFKEKNKEYYETNKNKINKRNKEYYEKNVELFKEQGKEYRKNNKDRYKCEKCNISTYSKKDFNKHIQTKKHNK